MDALEIRGPNVKLAALRLCFDLHAFDTHRIVQAVRALEELYGSRFAIVRTTTIAQAPGAVPAQAHSHFVVDIVPCQAHEAKSWNRFKLRVLAMFRFSGAQRTTAEVLGSTAAQPNDPMTARSAIEAELATEMARMRPSVHHGAEYETWIKLLREVGFGSAPIRHEARPNGRGVDSVANE